MPVKKDYYLWILIILTYNLLFCPNQGDCSSEQIGIFLSSKIRPYVQALNGLEQSLNYDYQTFDLNENFPLAQHYCQNGKFLAAVAIGPEATKLLFNNSCPNISLKFSIMTLDIKKIVNEKQACGIDLRVPIERQLEIINSYLKSVKQIAILYNKAENQEIIQRAQIAAKSLKIKILPLEVKDPSEIMLKLNPLLNKIDLILFIPDSVVISEKVVRHITKRALLAGIATCGFNSFFYEIGALLSFVIDYKELGKKAAKLLEKSIIEKECKIIPPPFRIWWNDKAFNALKRIHPEKWDRLKLEVHDL